MFRFRYVVFIVALALVNTTAVLPRSSNFVNQIEGTVYDQQQNPVYNAYVELYNDVSSQIGHTRTSTQGRFLFSGMTQGNFSIRVRPYGTNLMEDTQEVQINNQAQRSDIVVVEFRLRINKRISPSSNGNAGEAIFVQEVPDNARNLFKSGAEKLDNRDLKGLKDLEAALAISPDYFDANSRLGRELVTLKEYEKGYPRLLRAIDVNQRCVTCYYSIAFAFYQMKQYPAAVKASAAAAILDQSNVDIQLLWGTVLRLNGDYSNSEKQLLKALTLSKKPNAEVHWQLSLLYNKMNRNHDAANELEAYLKIAPDGVEKQKVQELIGKLRTQK